jgi:hypothetical protein
MVSSFSFNIQPLAVLLINALTPFVSFSLSLSPSTKGKVVKLKRPFLVLRKSSTELIIEGIIEEKYLFDSYPKTIMRAINA